MQHGGRPRDDGVTKDTKKGSMKQSTLQLNSSLAAPPMAQAQQMGLFLPAERSKDTCTDTERGELLAWVHPHLFSPSSLTCIFSSTQAGCIVKHKKHHGTMQWWDNIRQILYCTATMMPNHAHDLHFDYKKCHIRNDFVHIIWNDLGMLQHIHDAVPVVYIITEPHSPLSAITTFSSMSSPTTPTTIGPRSENKYLHVTVEHVPGMMVFMLVGNFKPISVENLPLLVCQLSFLAD
jgi:hypothetical protein